MPRIREDFVVLFVASIAGRSEYNFHMTLAKPLCLLIVLFSVKILSMANEQGRYTPVALGKWGGTGVEFVVGKNDVTIEYDCASGTIPGQLKTDRRGNFKVAGFHKYGPFGALRVNLQPKPLPARYEGKVTGRTLKYKVILTDTGEVVGEYTVGRGTEPRIRKCR